MDTGIETAQERGQGAAIGAGARTGQPPETPTQPTELDALIGQLTSALDGTEDALGVIRGVADRTYGMEMPAQKPLATAEVAEHRMAFERLREQVCRAESVLDDAINIRNRMREAIG